MVETQTHAQYLGLPVAFGRSRTPRFSQIRDRICKHLLGWQEKKLSQAGREVMIKSVVQSIPTYLMSCFQIPTSVCQDIEKTTCCFWWDSAPDEKKMHWVSWKKISLQD